MKHNLSPPYVCKYTCLYYDNSFMFSVNYKMIMLQERLSFYSLYMKYYKIVIMGKDD